ncbi:MAG: ribonuclease III [Alphaproteobacteria bacterium]
MGVRGLEEKINYTFTNRALLREALTHSSVKEGKNFERLEFLGDRVLGLIIADLVYKAFVHEKEGHLSRRFAALVSRQICEKVARSINLDQYLLFCNIDEKNFFLTSVLSDAMEALIGALFLDGGFYASYEFVKKHWGTILCAALKPPKDPKSVLQEWVQKKGLNVPTYYVVDKTGPEHLPFFEIKLVVEGYEEVYGQGHSKRQAEQNTAKKFIDEYINYG